MDMSFMTFIYLCKKKLIFIIFCILRYRHNRSLWNGIWFGRGSRPFHIFCANYMLVWGETNWTNSNLKLSQRSILRKSKNMLRTAFFSHGTNFDVGATGTNATMGQISLVSLKTWNFSATRNRRCRSHCSGCRCRGLQSLLRGRNAAIRITACDRCRESWQHDNSIRCTWCWIYRKRSCTPTASAETFRALQPCNNLRIGGIP